MIKKILAEKLNEYNPKNSIEQENILQELVQYYVLASLAKTDFFTRAAFHGGTFLRFIHSSNRFSEDLDFVLKKTDKNFTITQYLSNIREDGRFEGINFEIIDKSKAEISVRKAFLKSDSIGKILLIDLPYERHHHKKITVKLEVDTNPPSGCAFETHYINFPQVSMLTTQSIDSSFASKSHALLCRKYIKGRDWYDFLWYVMKNVKINFPLLKNALFQQGPWKGKNIEKIDVKWYYEEMKKKISHIDWNYAKEDVRRFLPINEQKSLDLWTENIFVYYLSMMVR